MKDLRVASSKVAELSGGLDVEPLELNAASAAINALLRNKQPPRVEGCFESTFSLFLTMRVLSRFLVTMG
jgi:hypothetical protein